MKNMKKILVLALAALLLVAVSVAGTVAYLTATTDPVTNTFMPSTLSVALTETDLDTTTNTREIKMVPGASVAKDPKVSYSTDVPAYVFVKVTETIGTGLTFSDYIGYSVITEGDYKWNKLSSANGVYYMEVTDGSSPEGGISVIRDSKKTTDKVTIQESVDLAAMQKLLDDNGVIDKSKCPKLTFEAYIIQKEPFSDASAAWTELTKPSSGT